MFHTAVTATQRDYVTLK